MSGDRIAAKVRRGVARAGAKTGTGLPLTGTITRRSAADTTTHPPTPGADKDYTFIAGQDSFTFADYQRTEITERDVKIMVTRPVRAADGEEIEPRNGDLLTIGGHKYHIENIDPEAFGGVAMFWMCRCRSAAQ